jgi:methylamine dehydrogenase accessory protein MauD
MTSYLWQISVVVLWILVVLMAVVLVALVRQLGVLTVRLNPAAAHDLGEGPDPGTPFPIQALTTLAGRELVIGGTEQQAAVVAFVSPGCRQCDTMVPAFHAIAKDYADDPVRLVIGVIADDRTAGAYAQQLRLDGLDVVPAGSIAKRLAINSTPYALAVGSNGLVAKRGVVNALEHLEEMLEIAQIGASRGRDEADITGHVLKVETAG